LRRAVKIGDLSTDYAASCYVDTSPVDRWILSFMSIVDIKLALHAHTHTKLIAQTQTPDWVMN